MTRVGIVGIGHGVFGRRSDATVQELAFEAFKAAMDDAGIKRDALDASVIGSVPEYHKQRSLPGVVQEYLGLNPKPTWLTEVACASGSGVTYRLDGDQGGCARRCRGARLPEDD